jgi:hypothetical protein
MNPRYPIYIPSKGRWANQMTSRHLTRMGVPHYIVVEEQELDLYRARKTRLSTFLVLDPSYRDRHETCDDFGHTRSFGAGPARNFAWDHAISLGAERHWDVDDNIDGFYRYNHNLKTPVADGTVLRVMEDFADRYTNVGIAGPQYFMFVSRKEGALPPFVANTRIYSCSLIRNDVPLRWRLRMNEDTDLSLRVLKLGLCTVQFNAFLQYKSPTQTMKGGYNSEFYAREGTMWKSQMLVDQHPDVARIAWRFGRWHHYVDYTPFMKANHLELRPGVAFPDAIDNYGMKLQRRLGSRWYDIERPTDTVTTEDRRAFPSDLVAAPTAAATGSATLFGEDATAPAGKGHWQV